MRLEFHYLDTDECGQGDVDGVDEEQVERPQEICELEGGDAVACSAERRHEGSGDGDARDDIPLALRGYGEDAGCAAEESDQHIVDRGRRACQQFRMVLAHGRYEEVAGRGYHRESGGRRQVAQAPFQQFVVTDSHPQANAYDGPHEGRDEHGADDYGRRVGVQAQRGY